jgi:hypothetical protein
MIYFNCHFRNKNTVGGGQVVTITCSNVFGVTSSFIPLATGVQSNVTHKFIGGALTQEGTNTSNCFYLEGVGEFSVDGGLYFSFGGKAIFYLDSRSQAPLYNASINNIRQEFAADYAFYLNGAQTGNADAPYNVSVTNNHFSQSTPLGEYFLFADNGVVMYEWEIYNNTACGILDAFDITYSNIDFNDTFQVRSIFSGSQLKSFSFATTIVTNNNSQVYNKENGGIQFTGSASIQSPASRVTLSAGTSSVFTGVPYIKANAAILLTPANASAAALSGVYISAIVPGTGFTITHSSAAGTEIFNCFIVNGR